MSFRSVSVLPTCLYARLGPNLSLRRRNLTVRQICASSSKHRARSPTRHVQNTSRYLNTEERPNSRDGTGSYSLQLDAVRSLSDQCVEPTIHHQSKARTEGKIKAPEIIQDSNEPEILSEAQSTAEDNVSQVRTTTLGDSSARYKKWEKLHDRFLDVRRKCPAQTADTFRKERSVAKRFLGEYTDDGFQAHQFKYDWLSLTSQQQYELLPSLLIGSLVESAAAGLFVLQHVELMSCSFQIRMNCLRHIAMMYWKDLQDDRDLRRRYKDQIGGLRPSKLWPQNRLPAVLLQNLLFWSTPAQCTVIIQEFLEKYPDLESSSLIAIIDHYIRIKDPETALEYIRQLPENLLRHPNANVKALRDGLVKMDTVAKNENGTNFKYLPQLLALGIPPDETLHNTVIESAILNGLPDVAWDLYRYLETSRFRSNARTHLVLLRDAFHKGELQRVNEIMTTIHNREDLISDQYLMAFSMNIVRNISFYERQLEPREACAHIMALYDRAYDRGPLIRLGIIRPNPTQVDMPQPTPTLLAFTIWTYVLIQRQDSHVLRLWGWIKQLIANQDVAILESARYDIFYNAMVLFHARKLSGLFRALEVVQYMLSNRLCLPTSRTWSILLCAFLRHGQVEQARKVMTFMQSKGFEVLEVNEKYGGYVPTGSDLLALADMAKQDSNERDMPVGIEDLLADCKSLQREASSDMYS